MWCWTRAESSKVEVNGTMPVVHAKELSHGCGVLGWRFCKKSWLFDLSELPPAYYCSKITRTKDRGYWKYIICNTNSTQSYFWPLLGSYKTCWTVRGGSQHLTFSLDVETPLVFGFNTSVGPIDCTYLQEVTKLALGKLIILPESRRPSHGGIYSIYTIKRYKVVLPLSCTLLPLMSRFLT